MNQANLQNEPTMDEILASIRKIISEDHGEPDDKKAAEPTPAVEPQSAAQEASAPIAPDVAEAPAANAAEAAGAEAELDISKLAAEMAADEPAELPPVTDLSTGAGEPGETFLDVVSSETAGHGELAPEEALPEEYIVETAAEDGLISDSARSAFDHALDQFDEEEERGSRPSIATGDSVEAVFARAVQQALEPTLQDWVDGNRDEIMRRLTPLIREWMDENLPPLIEAAVAKEIARAVRARRR